jgi:tetratricopeptide (TPR) repeat protein
MADIPASDLVAAARALSLAGRWPQATALLAAADAADDAERAVLAVAAAGAAVDQDFWARTTCGATALDRASAAIDRLAEAPEDVVFDLSFAALKHDYDEQLFGTRDATVAEALAERASALRGRAPDPARRARAAFYAGLIGELLRGDAEAGRLGYEEALRLGEESGDELIVSYACRHLGSLAFDAGDVDRARALLRRSLELRQRLGCVPHVLAQLFALAEVDAAESVAGAAAAARMVRDWAAAAFPDSWLVPAAESLLAPAAS